MKPCANEVPTPVGKANSMESNGVRLPDLKARACELEACRCCSASVPTHGPSIIFARRNGKILQIKTYPERVDENIDPRQIEPLIQQCKEPSAGKPYCESLY